MEGRGYRNNWEMSERRSKKNTFTHARGSSAAMFKWSPAGGCVFPFGVVSSLTPPRPGVRMSNGQRAVEAETRKILSLRGASSRGKLFK